MDFGKVFKIIQLNVLQQSGVPVTADQFGLSPSDVATGSNFNSPFSAVLGSVQAGAVNGGGVNNLNMPEPPTAPSDPNDLQAQQLFNEQMVNYNQELNAYNQRMMQVLLAQFRQLQLQTAATGAAMPPRRLPLGHRPFRRPMGQRRPMPFPCLRSSG